MAKKEKLQLDPFSTDNDLDWDGFDIDDIDGQVDPNVNSKKRNPVMETFKGVVESAKEEVKSKSFYSNLLKKALPPAYGEITDAVDQASGTMSSLYDDAVRDVRPQIGRLAGKIDKLVPEENKTIKKVLGKLKEGYINPSQNYYNKDKVKEESIAQGLAGVFGAQTNVTKQLYARTEAKEEIKENISAKRFQADHELFKDMRDNIVRFNNYNEKVTQAYQKKSLELQFRSYFAQEELSKNLNRHLEVLTKHQEAIVKNTALPEFKKIHMSEDFIRVGREKMFNKAQNALYGPDSQLGKIFANLSKQGKSLLAGAKDALSGAEEGYNMAEGFLDSGMDEFMPKKSKYEKIGYNALNGAKALFLNDLIGEKLGKHVPTQVHEAVYGVASKIKNISGHMNKWTKDNEFMRRNRGSDKWWDPKTHIANVAGFGLDALKLRQEHPTQFTVDSKANELGFGFNNKTQMAIVEVIPGYLARILREVTKDVDATTASGYNDKMTVYDYNKRQFMFKSKRQADTLQSYKDKINNSNQGTYLNSAIKDIKEKAGLSEESTYLSDTDEDSLKQLILDLAPNRSDSTLDFDDVLKSDEYKKMSLKAKALFRLYIKKAKADAKTSKKSQYDFTTHVLDVERNALKIEAMIGKLYDEGDHELAGELGLTKKQGKYHTVQTNTIRSMTDETAKKSGANYKQVNEMLAKLKFSNNTEYTRDQKTKLATAMTNPENMEVLLRERLIVKIPDKDMWSVSEGKLSEFDSIIQKLPVGSSEFIKTNLKKLSGSVLAAINKVPINSWSYKAGEGDGKAHIGPMAQKIHSIFGDKAAPADGTKLDLTTMNGINMAAIQELFKMVGNPSSQESSAKIDEIQNSIHCILDHLNVLSPSGSVKGSKLNHYDTLLAFGNEAMKRGFNKLDFNLKDGQSEEKLREHLETFNKHYEELKEQAKKTYKDKKAKLEEYDQLHPEEEEVAKEYHGRKGLARILGGFLGPKLAKAPGHVFDRYSKAIPKAMAVGSAVTAAPLAAVSTVGALTLGTARTALRITDRAMSPLEDMYIKGKEHEGPVLLGKLLKKGKYFCLTSNKVIKSVSDIKGIVTDLDGNIILNLEDAPEGLVNKKGKPITTTFSKIAKRLAKQHEARTKRLTKAFGLAGKIGGTIAGSALGILVSKRDKQELSDALKSSWGKAKRTLDKYSSTLHGHEPKDPLHVDNSPHYAGKGLMDTLKGMGGNGLLDTARNVFTNRGDIANSAREAAGEFASTEAGQRLSSAGNRLRDSGLGRFVTGTANRAVETASTGRLGRLGRGIAGSRIGTMAGGLLSRGMKEAKEIGGAASQFLTKKPGETTGEGEDTKQPLGHGDAHHEHNPHATTEPTDKKHMTVKEKGSAENRLEAKDAAAKERAKQVLEVNKDAKYKSKNFFDGFLDKIKGFMDLFGKGISSVFGKVGSLFNVLKNIPGVGKILEGAGKIGSKVFSAGKWAVNAGANIAKGARVAKALQTIGTVARYARIAMMVGSLGTGGLAGVAMGAMSMITGAASLILGSTIGLPLAAAAIAGYGLYKAYKRFTRNDINNYQRVRLYQYGLRDSNKGHYHEPLELEAYLMDGRVGYGPNGAYILEKKANMEEILGFFSIDKGDTEKVADFFKWFNQRFKPFFLLHLSVLYGIDPKAKLDQIEKLEADKRLKYLSGISYESGPYSETTSPFKDVDKLSSDKDTVLNLIKLMTQDVKQVADQANKEKDGRAKQIAALMAKAPPKPDIDKNTTLSDYTKTKALKDAVNYTKDAKNDKSKLPISPEDGESKAKMSTGGAPSGPIKVMGNVSKTVGSIPTAGGDFKDGSGADKYLKVSGNAKIEGTNPTMLRNFRAMVQEYGELTGKSVVITSGYRSNAYQRKLHDDDPHGVAWPRGMGSDGRFHEGSLHEFGLAFDVDHPSGKSMYEMDKLGLSRKYGFTRPVGSEPWHVEPAGIQGDLDKARSSPEAATSMVNQSPGRGGAGLGSIPGSRMGRDVMMARQLWGSTGPTVNTKSKEEEGASEPGATTSKTSTTATMSGIDSLPEGAGKESMKKLAGSKYQAAGTATTTSSGPSSEAANDSGISTSKSGSDGSFPGYKPYQDPAKAEEGESKSKMNTGGGTGSYGNSGSYAGTVSPGGNSTPSSGPSKPMAGNKQEIKAIIDKAAQKVGVNPNMMEAFASQESRFDPNAHAPGKGQTATGLFQFVKNTWDGLKDKLTKFGIDPNSPPTDPVANATLGSIYAKMNTDNLKKIKSNPSILDVYSTHLTGNSMAAKANAKDPSTPVSTVVGQGRHGPLQIVDGKQIASNSSLFPQGPNTSVGSLFSVLKANLIKATKEMGLNINPDEAAIGGGPTSNQLAEQNAPKPGDGGMSTGSFPGANPDAKPGYSKDKGSSGGIAGGSYPGTIGSSAPSPSMDTGGSSSSTGAFPGYKPYKGPTDSAANDMGTNTSFAATPTSMTSKASDVGQGFSMTGVETKLTDINGTLTQSLDIQKQMLAAIQAMSGKSSNDSTAAANGITSADPNIRNADNQKARPMPDGVTDLSRMKLYGA